MSYPSYALKRVLSSVFILFSASVVIFSIIRLIPGDPAALALGEAATPEALERLRIEMGLNLPIWEQYVMWITNMLTLEIGEGMISGYPIGALLEVRFPRSLQLAFTALIIAVGLAIPLGVTAAVNRNTNRDYIALLFSQAGISVPSFLVGIILILVFAGWLKWFPTTGYRSLTEDPLGNLYHLVLPSVAMGLINAAILTRFVRSEMLDVLNEDYVKTARAFGHPRKRIIRKYVMKNAMIPTITVIGLRFGGIIGGVVVIETVFVYPGIGLMILDSLLARDYTTLQVALLLVATAFILVNLVVDLLYGWLDPRIKY